ncbi:MAG: TonB-dependent receptor [Pseudomonadota bacterium]
MKLMNTLSAGAAAVALMTGFATVVAPTAAMAQQTTSEITGVVTDANGSALSGAQVTVIDTRTGARRSFTTGSNGEFSARGLTVGGPYSVAVSASGFQPERITGINIGLGGGSSLRFDLERSTSTDEIVVVSTRRNTAQVAIGPNSTFGLETIEALPSISRDIRDIIRVDPRLTVSGGDDAVSCLGGNNRFNSFTLDGVQSNDAFGLNASGLPARGNFPIPFDAIQQTAVEFSPFDVEYGQFTGCNINIVTKSGTNEFSGAAFAVFNSRSLTGSTIDGNEVLSDAPFRDFNWGASIGGPIIKDKLFFFVAYEEIDDGGTIINFGPEDGAFADPVPGFTLAQAGQIQDILLNSYGIDVGNIANVVPEESRRIATRWDWYITDNHRLEFTYSREREAEIETDDAPFAAQFSFDNSFEISGSSNEFYSARLFSQWTDNLSTELRVSRRDNEDIQNPVGGGEAQDANPIPRFLINTDGDIDNGFEVTTGPGQFRSANALITQTDQIKAKADYVAGNHTFTAGYELNNLDVFNLFAVNATGTFLFNSIEDLANGITMPLDGDPAIEATGSFSGDINDAAASFSRSAHSFYIQDEWNPIDPLTLTLGLRYDFYTSGDTPTESQSFIDRYGFSNAVGFENLEILMPRFGLNYDAGQTFFGDTTFRAGAGVFSGGDPTVWFSNAFSNFGSGLGDGETGNGTCTDADLQVLAGGQFTGVPQCIIAQQQAEAALGQGRTDAIDPDFDIPSVVRGSFGLTHFTDFGGSAGGFFDDWRIDMDVIVTRRRNAPDFVDLTLTPNGTILPDGRPQFNAVDPLLAGCDATFVGPRVGFTGGDLSNGGPCDAGFDDQDILLTNVRGDNGGSVSFSTQFSKTYDYDLFGVPSSARINLGYAFTSAKDVNPTTSSTATSNFEEVALAVINNPVLAPSQFVNRHTISLATTFRHEFVRDLPTSFSFFVQAREGQPFSFTYDNNTPTSLFGDSDNEERNLFYVPTGPTDPLVQFADGFDTDGFFAFLDETGLNQFAGQISPRNAFRQPWFVDMDFRFQQDLPMPVRGLRSIFYVDVENLPNLISDGTNIFRSADSGDVAEGLPVLDAALSADGTQYVYSNFNPGGGGFDPEVGIFADEIVGASLWAVQFGLRFEF